MNTQQKMAIHPKEPQYASYLLRLRWTEDQDAFKCQAMLRSVASQEQHYFADLDSLVAFLQERGVDALHSLGHAHEDLPV